MVTHLKLVAVGDGGVGKSSMLIACATGKFPHDYVPTVFGSWAMETRLHGQEYKLSMWDTAGQEDYDRLRPLSYPGNDVIFICFAVNNRDSFMNVTNRWIPELRQHTSNIPKILVACKTDLRNSDTQDYVTYAEGSKLAKDLGLRYQEISALTRDGLATCINRAIVEANQGLAARRRKKERLEFFKRIQREIPRPPSLPSPEKSQKIWVQPSQFADDWRRMLERPRYADVTFVLDGGQRIDAHSLVLCSASAFFCQVFGVRQNKKSKKTDHVEPFSRTAMTAGHVKGISAINEDRKCDRGKGHHRNHTTIALTSDIKYTTFSRVLEFLYTGMPCLPEDHGYTSLEEVNEIIRVSKVFKLSRLNEICQNYIMGQDFLNPSIGSSVNDETGQTMEILYLNNEEYADVVFSVQGKNIYSNKVVLCARCRALADLFGNQKRTRGIMKIDIPSTSAMNFQVFLGYIYTDQFNANGFNVKGIMGLASAYNMERLLNMCELHVTKEVQKSVTNDIQRCIPDIVGLLLAAQSLKANQLRTWCLHFISSNYIAFKNNPDMERLKGDNLSMVTKNQWPPASYLEDIRQYEMKWTNSRIECSLM